QVAAELRMARIGLRGLAVMVRLGDLDSRAQPLLLLFPARAVVDALAEAHHGGGNVGVLEQLHHVVCAEQEDVGPPRPGDPRHLRHGALAGVVALLLGGKLDLLLQVFLGAQLRQLVELEGAVAIGQRRIASISLHALIPLLRRRCQQRAVRGPHAENDLCHVDASPRSARRPLVMIALMTGGPMNLRYATTPAASDSWRMPQTAVSGNASFTRG